MAMPITISYDSSAPGFQLGGQLPVSCDWTMSPFDLRVSVFIPAGSTATYGLEWTPDTLDTSPIRWFPDATLPAGTTMSGTSVYSAPIAFVRINISSLSGTIEMKTIQGLPT
jgi:hypothetical protein